CAEADRIIAGTALTRTSRVQRRCPKMMRKFYSALTGCVLIFAWALTVVAQDWDHAVSLYNQKQYRPAIREFHALLKANPDAWQSWYYIGSSHFQLQSYEDAIDAFQNYLKSAEKDEKGQAAGNYYIGMSQYQLKQYDKAIASLGRYIS